jgi:glycosyltransferase involved in cell wall biosynthesis
MRIAIVHEWLTSYAGSEQVVEQILSLFPDADLYSLVDFMRDSERRGITKRARTSFLQHLPFARTRYRNFLPLMPFAVERFDLSSYDLILSSSHAVAKGVRKRPGQLHICYCHTPMRYAWDLRDQYLRETRLHKGLKGFAARMLLDRLRKWDARTAAGVDHFIANSRYIAERILRSYGRESTVIYPPVDVEGFSLSEKKEDFYVAASRMVPYKKMDLIVDAFSRMQDRKLIVIGDGPDLRKVSERAGKNVELLGYQEADVLKGYLQRAKAFVFAAEEDFGIVPVEAQACGTPVIAFGRGGALETVVPLDTEEQAASIKDAPAPTGVFFHEQTAEALIDAVGLFEGNADRFDYFAIRRHAERFGRERFRKEYRDFVDAKMTDHRVTGRS